MAKPLKDVMASVRIWLADGDTMWPIPFHENMELLVRAAEGDASNYCVTLQDLARLLEELGVELPPDVRDDEADALAISLAVLGALHKPEEVVGEDEEEEDE